MTVSFEYLISVPDRINPGVTLRGTVEKDLTQAIALSLRLDTLAANIVVIAAKLIGLLQDEQWEKAQQYMAQESPTITDLFNVRQTLVEFERVGLVDKIMYWQCGAALSVFHEWGKLQQRVKEAVGGDSLGVQFHMYYGGLSKKVQELKEASGKNIADRLTSMLAKFNAAKRYYETTVVPGLQQVQSAADKKAAMRMFIDAEGHRIQAYRNDLSPFIGEDNLYPPVADLFDAFSLIPSYDPEWVLPQEPMQNKVPSKPWWKFW